MGDSMAWPMVDTMPSFMALGMASSMDPSMASPMVGVHDAVHGRCHTCLLYTSPSPRD